MVTKTARTTKKVTTKKAATSRAKTARVLSRKVDYYPNRMTVAVSLLAVVSLLLLSVMAMYGLR